MSAELPLPVARALRLVRVDLAPDRGQPSAVSILVATAASNAGSLGADALLVFLGQAVFLLPGAMRISSSPTTRS
ncbi:MAG TPA: hypothetical protein VIL16_28485 [Trebonia sp.]